MRKISSESKSKTDNDPDQVHYRVVVRIMNHAFHTYIKRVQGRQKYKKLKMKVFVLFSLVAADLKFTCQQAEQLCYDGVYIEKASICATEKCLHEDPNACDELTLFADGQYTRDYCENTSNPLNIDAIGARNKWWRRTVCAPL